VQGFVAMSAFAVHVPGDTKVSLPASPLLSSARVSGEKPGQLAKRHISTDTTPAILRCGHGLEMTVQGNGPRCPRIAAALFPKAVQTFQ